MQFIKRYPYFFLCLLFSLPLFFIGTENKHDWGDDFAQYITEAKNISEGTAYAQSNYVPNPNNTQYTPPSYPPGYPLLMALLSKLTGFSMQGFLLQISFFLALSIFAGFAFFKTHFSKRSSFLLALLLVYNPIVMNLKWQVLADLPLLLLLVLYFRLRRKEAPKAITMVLCGLLLTFACMFRTQTLLLVLAECIAELYYAYKWKEKQTALKNVLIVLGSFAFATVFVQISPYKTETSTFSFYANLFQISGFENYNLAHNLHYTSDLLRGFFTLPSSNSLVVFITQRGSDVLVLLFLLGLISSHKKLRTPEFIFLCLQVIVIILLPVKQGARYFLPALPLYILCAAMGLEKITGIIKSHNLKTEIQIIALLYVGSILYFSSKAAFEKKVIWVETVDKHGLMVLKKKLPANALLVCTKPRYIAYETGLHCSIFDDDFTKSNPVAKANQTFYLARENDQEEGTAQLHAHLRKEFKVVKVIGNYTVYTAP